MAPSWPCHFPATIARLHLQDRHFTEPEPPSTPPAALMSATASSAPSFICSYVHRHRPATVMFVERGARHGWTSSATNWAAPSSSPTSRCTTGYSRSPAKFDRSYRVWKMGKRRGRLFRRTVAPAQRPSTFVQPEANVSEHGDPEREGGDCGQKQRTECRRARSRADPPRKGQNVEAWLR